MSENTCFHSDSNPRTHKYKIVTLANTPRKKPLALLTILVIIDFIIV